MTRIKFIPDKAWKNHLAFMRFRRELDIKRFSQAAGEQSNLFQLITGMQEIKLNNCETQVRWKWERIQVKLFKISIKGLALQQYQQLGGVFFSQTTGILISFVAAWEQLLNSLNEWRLRYCLVAPVAGLVTFTKYWNQNQYIPSGEVAFTVVPPGGESLDGKGVDPHSAFGEDGEGAACDRAFLRANYDFYIRKSGEVVRMYPRNFVLVHGLKIE